MIRRATRFGVGGAAVAMFVAWAALASAEESTEAQAGHNLYSEHCEVCHGLRGHGDGPLAEELRVAPADLTIIAQRRGGVFPESEMREIIDGRRKVRAHGPANMPLWGEVFAQQRAGGTHEIEVRDKVQSLVDYLKSIQQPAPPAPEKK
jgi:mono/diheme cytochrome c family protein